jgi:hypothetical protein
MPGEIARIVYNRLDWRQPSGDARHSEVGTYASEKGFGHEEWLFRSEWQIDGWRYAFVQGVNKSRKRLLTKPAPFDLRLFTKRTDGRRLYVADIRDVMCLTDDEARRAWDVFCQRGWAEAMYNEVREVDGDPAAIGDPTWTSSILNIRFRPADVGRFPAETFAGIEDRVQRLDRYRLFSDVGGDNVPSTRAVRPGLITLPSIDRVERSSASAITYDAVHAKMQAALMRELQAKHGDHRVRREQGFVDIIVDDDGEVTFYEIKSDPSPRTVIREALGQILEYAYHASGPGLSPHRLVIVGRVPMAAADAHYLALLCKRFSLPVEYRTVEP